MYIYINVSTVYTYYRMAIKCSLPFKCPSEHGTSSETKHERLTEVHLNDIYIYIYVYIIDVGNQKNGLPCNLESHHCLRVYSILT